MRRTLFRMRLPLAIFIILILVSCAASSAILYSAFTAHVHGDYFRLETERLDVVFPRNWYAVPWEEKNSSGQRWGMLLAPGDLRASMFITIFDENAARTYLEQNDLSDGDAFSAAISEARRLHNWTLQQNVNATLRFIENGTISVSGYAASFSRIIIEGGFVDQGQYYNWTWTLMSFVDREVFQVAYHGVEDDYDRAHESFQFILNSTRIRIG